MLRRQALFERALFPEAFACLMPLLSLQRMSVQSAATEPSESSLVIGVLPGVLGSGVLLGKCRLDHWGPAKTNT
jgi:hypothetical protein